MRVEQTLESITLLMNIKDIDLKRLESRYGKVNAIEVYKSIYSEANDCFGNARYAKNPEEFIYILWNKINYVKQRIDSNIYRCEFDYPLGVSRIDAEDLDN